MYELTVIAEAEAGHDVITWMQGNGAETVDAQDDQVDGLLLIVGRFWRNTDQLVALLEGMGAVRSVAARDLSAE